MTRLALLLLASASLSLTGVVACQNNANPAATATPEQLAAPADVRITGALPNLRTPVPPGQGELGRITVEWRDNSSTETGFRIFQDCQGTVIPLVDVPANETRHGPLQTCRPGRIGVSAFNATSTSAITWTP